VFVLARSWSALALAAGLIGGACGVPVALAPVPLPVTSIPSAAPTLSASPAPTATPTPSPTATPSASPSPALRTIAEVLDRIEPARLDAHLAALVATVSRDPRHPGHEKALAYLEEQLGRIDGVNVRRQIATAAGIPLVNLIATIDPPGGAPKDGWLLLAAHYDATANRTPGWRPALDPAPGADDNGTGTASLLELARVLAAERANLRQRVVLAFFDGEELFFKGAAAYLVTLPKPYPVAAVVNLDMVGQNPIADRLDLIWYTQGSAALRDRVVAANDRYAIGIRPLNQQFAGDADTILDAAPFGLAGIPAVALVERYGEDDAAYSANPGFHTVNDDLAHVTNKRLWLKATRLTLAVALELARAP